MNDMETRSGLQPVNSGRLPFEITTDNVEQFLQERMDRITDSMRRKGIKIDDVEVTVLSTDSGKGFIPFLIMLPTTVLVKDSNEKKSDDKEKNKGYIPEAFKTGGSSGKINIYEPIFLELQSYSYTKEDRSAFFSRQWRNDLGVSLDEAQTLKYNSIPRVQRINRGNDTFVTLMIDPLKVFKTMLEDPKNPSRFFIEINRVTKFKPGSHKYFITRCPDTRGNKKKNRHNSKDRLAQEMINSLKRR